MTQGTKDTLVVVGIIAAISAVWFVVVKGVLIFVEWAQTIRLRR